MRRIVGLVDRLALLAHAEPVGQVVSLSFGMPRRFSLPGLDPLPWQCGALVVLPSPAEASVCGLAAPSSYGNPLLYPKTPAHRWGAGVCRDSRREAAEEVPLTPLPTPWVGQVCLGLLPVPHSCAQVLTVVRYSSCLIAGA